MQVPTANPALPKTDIPKSRFDKVRILADDLTGACDSAAAFLTLGNTVRVWLGAVASHPASESIQAFHTASRNLESHSAANAVSQAISAISSDPRTLWFKKVDSAGRGAIAAEVLAAHKALATRAILFAPSFPAAGRTVRDGVLYIADAAGINTQIPLLPEFQQFAATIHLSHPDHLSNALHGAATVIVCDAATQNDLEMLAAIDAPEILFAGSAGLAQALAAVHFHANPPHVQPMPRLTRPITISGSLHRVTSLQMTHLAQALPQHLAMQIAAEPTDEGLIQAQFTQHSPDAFILTGGDTAQLVLQTLGAHSILLRGEMCPGIPWGFIQGGRAHGRIVVTKSGGFGSVDSLTRIVQQLTGDTSE